MTVAVTPDDLERILSTFDRASWWDYFVGGATAAAAIASVAVAIVASALAGKADKGRRQAELDLRDERAENRLRDALRGLIDVVTSHVELLSKWGNDKPLIDLPNANFVAEHTLGEIEEMVLSRRRAVPSYLREAIAHRPPLEPPRGVLDMTLLSTTVTAQPLLKRLRTLVLTVVVAPQWHGAAHLSDINAAVARWSASSAGERRFADDLDTIEAHYLDLFQQANGDPPCEPQRG